MIFYLREIAHARAGDKGDTNNIGLIAYEPAFYPMIVEQITSERIREHFKGLVQGPVTRFELPQLYAMNFVLERALGGGVTRSLSLDPHGKSYSALILTIPVSVPEDLSLKLLQAGRKPLPEDTDAGPWPGADVRPEGAAAR